MKKINLRSIHGPQIALNKYIKTATTLKGAQMKQNGNNTNGTTTNVSQSKLNLTTQFKTLLHVMVLAVVVSSCTKNREAALPDDAAPNVYAISMFGTPDENSPFAASKEEASVASDSDVKILDLNQAAKLSADEVSVPERVKFMFDKLPMTSQTARQFKITFSVDKNNITAYKVATSVKDLNAIEKSLAISAHEAQLLVKLSHAQKAELKSLSAEQKSAATEREQIKSGKAVGALLVPMFKYEIAGYGVLERTKNELKEDTSVLRLKETDWAQATHIQIKSLTDSRKVVGMDASQAKAMSQLFKEEKIDKRVTTAGELANDLKIGLKFLDSKTPVMTKLSATDLLIYEITDASKLTEDQARIYKAGGSGGRVVSCNDVEVKDVVKSTNASCVVVLVASAPISYKKLELSLTDVNGTTSSNVVSTEIPKSQSVGLVEILENTKADQREVKGLLDPDSSIKISDLQGEFMFRRTFEDAATTFLGRTGTSGDMALVKFELEENRLVVRNQLSLIQYTGQGAKDREEIMSIPVKYYYVSQRDAHGSDLVLGSLVETTKENANYIKLDWTANSIPDSSSPLAFFDYGQCFIADSSKKITNTDMRLANDGVLNFSISSSHTVNPGCATNKVVNSAYWSGTMQLNFNIVERISFVKHTNKDKTDTQFTPNISFMAQEAFNYGVFTLADKNTENGSLANRDGSERYMPMIHDIRSGKTMKWYLGGINDATATNAERRELLVASAQQVIAEWNKTFEIAMKGTDLDRKNRQTDYIELVIEDAGKETGHLGDLNRNYIWMNEIPADNGLLGVAQPAANPRSGVIESANVIIYTGNTFEQSQILLKMTQISREYEKMIEELKKSSIEKAKSKKAIVSTQSEAAKAANAGANQKTVQKVSKTLAKNKSYLNSLIKYFELDNQNIKKSIQGTAMSQSAESLKRVLNKETFINAIKGQKIELPTNSATLSKKMTDLAMDKKLSSNPREFELRMNDLFINFGGLSEDVKSILGKRQQMLALSVQFDKTTAKRAGCFKYSRNDIEDAALIMDADPHKNLMLNFKQAVMSTLSHELGHAFGLMHNFKASTDKANYEFPGEDTGRNYSSIMDYIADIDQHYAGPGPYDAHAIRAAYTGYVQLSDAVLANPKAIEAIKASGAKLINDNSVHMNDLLKLIGEKSLVHFTKDTLNSKGLIKYYEQCSDGGMATSILCNQFDTGGTATEIVKNMIADYTRSYANRNYVYDKILFNWPQKIQLINRNIRTFSQIRTFLDETIMTAIYGSGRPDAENSEIMKDQVSAAQAGYQFFHELLRTPETSASFAKFNERFYAIPYSYEDAKTKTAVDDIKIVEARSLYDVAMSRDKLDTVGIGYDKIFAMNFLMQTSTTFSTDDSKQGFISYKDFEQFFLGVTDPKDSLTLNTMTEILTNNLKMGFFDPNGKLISVANPVEVNKMLGDQTALASIVGLSESKWKAFDPFAESFKMARATVKSAPRDRLNIARLGQDRSKSDTTVYFATQNGVAANVIVKQAARGDVLLGNKSEIFKTFSNLMTADNVYMDKINALREAACSQNDDGTFKDEAGCKAAFAKPIADYIKDDASLVPAKQKADAIVKQLVNSIRHLNGQGAIMDTQLDAADSKVNFANQAEVIRLMMNEQMSVLNSMKMDLEKSSKDDLATTIPAILDLAKQMREQNDKLSSVALISYAQSFLVETAKAVQIKLQSGEELTGDVLMKMMMDGEKIQNSHEKIVDIIDKLTQYSRFVDVDLLVTK